MRISRAAQALPRLPLFNTGKSPLEIILEIFVKRLIIILKSECGAQLRCPQGREKQRESSCSGEKPSGFYYCLCCLP